MKISVKEPIERCRIEKSGKRPRTMSFSLLLGMCEVYLEQEHK
jgi:hypothetical protein